MNATATPPPGMTAEQWKWIRAQCDAMDREHNRGARKPRQDAA